MRAPASYASLLLAAQYGQSHTAAARYAVLLRDRACSGGESAPGIMRSARIMAGLAREYHVKAAEVLGITLRNVVRT